LVVGDTLGGCTVPDIDCLSGILSARFPYRQQRISGAGGRETRRARERSTPETFFNPAQLRARALRLREMAEEFPGEDLERLLLEVADALDTRADALERQRIPS
jgi:hypothetical protein